MSNSFKKLEIFKLVFKELQKGENKSSLFVRLIFHRVKFKLFNKRAVSVNFGWLAQKSVQMVHWHIISSPGNKVENLAVDAVLISMFC